MMAGSSLSSRPGGTLLLPSLMNDHLSGSQTGKEGEPGRKSKFLSHVLKAQRNVKIDNNTSQNHLQKIRKIKQREQNEGGSLYVWGSTQDGQLGNGLGIQALKDEDEETDVKEPLIL